jgi:hypothetical protein
MIGVRSFPGVSVRVQGRFVKCELNGRKSPCQFLQRRHQAPQDRQWWSPHIISPASIATGSMLPNAGSGQVAKGVKTQGGL